MATRIPYETYHDAQCDRFFNPPPQEDTLKEMLCRDSEVEQVPYRKIDWPKFGAWGVIFFLLGCFYGGVKFAALMLSPFN